jgi:hypothetical protein
MAEDTIFKEVDEDIRREQYQRLWKTYGKYVIGGAVLIVVVVAGWLIWDNYRTQQAESSGDRFLNAVGMAEDGDHAGAVEALNAVAADSTGDYALLARFRAAREMAAAGDVEAGLAAYDTLAADGALTDYHRDLARVMGGYLAVDIEPYDAVRDRVESVAVDGNPWRQAAREIIAVAAYGSGQPEIAAEFLNAILEDPLAQAAARERADTLVQLLGAGEPTTTVAAMNAPSATSGEPFAFESGGAAATLQQGARQGNFFSDRFPVPGLEALAPPAEPDPDTEAAADDAGVISDPLSTLDALGLDDSTPAFLDAPLGGETDPAADTGPEPTGGAAPQDDASGADAATSSQEPTTDPEPAS